jgi:POT family proton-dependent oligopeptide transporter
VIAGALLMTAGHFCMAFEHTFLLALVLLIIGAGFLRGNLTPQVADLYGPGDHRRAVAFQIYASMVAVGAFIAPLITGLLSQVYDWDVAFGFAGVGMLLGLLVYVGGGAWLPAEPVRVPTDVPRAVLQHHEKRIAWTLLLLVPIGTLFWIAQAQIWNTYNLWVRDHVELRLAGWTIPVPWLQAIDGLAPLVTLPPLLAWWRWRALRGHPSDELGRMAAGCLIFGMSVLILAAAQALAGHGQRIPLLIPVLFHFVSNIGWLYFAPSANSLFAGTAPRPIRGMMIGIYTSSMFFGSVISGRLGALYEHISPAMFWMMHAVLAGLGGVVLWAISGWLRQIFNTTTPDTGIYMTDALSGAHGEPAEIH